MTGDTLNCFRFEINKLDPDISSILDFDTKCTITSQLLTNKEKSVYAITILGPAKEIPATKKTILQRNPSKHSIVIKTLSNIVYSTQNTIKPTVRMRFDEFSNQTDTTIEFQRVTDTEAKIEIRGEFEKAEKARMLCLVYLDELVGLAVFQISVPFKLQSMIAGRKRIQLNRIMQKTCTNFYCPIPFTIYQDTDSYYNTIYITGQPDDIQEATNEYFALVQSIESRIITKQVACLPRKFDWLFENRKKEIRKIMEDNGVFITFTTFNSNSISFSGTEEHLVERAIKALERLICDYYVASIQTLNVFESADQFSRYCKDAAPTLVQIISNHHVDITITRNIIELYGLDEKTKNAYQTLTSADWLKIRDTKFQVELGKEHREFINGKKNGKINRIIKTSGCRVSFQDTLNEYNMMIDLYSPVPSNLLMGIAMLEEELPAEMSFHIPEAFHKRIIGVAGKNIQKIMKRFGVYVKFSNTEEYQSLGGYYENSDNVICRTPSKNQDNLRDLKQTIVEAINATDLLETTAYFEFPRQLIHWCTRPSGESIHVMEEEAGVRIQLPHCESGDYTIQLDGPSTGLEQVKARLKALVPLVTDVQTPGGQPTLNLLKKTEFIQFKKKLQGDNITCWVSTSPADSDLEFSFYFIYPNSVNKKVVEEAKTKLKGIFQKLQVPFTLPPKPEPKIEKVEAKPEVKKEPKPEPKEVKQEPAPNAQGYDSFHHFNSKLLGNVSDTRNSQFGLFGSGSAPGSVQNLRQLFEDSPSNVPPGLHRSGSSDLRKSSSVIGRPTGPSSGLRRQMNESSNEYLRPSIHRSGLPDLAGLNVGKSVSMSDIMQASMPNDPNSSFSGYSWGQRQFNKSLSSSAILKDSNASFNDEFQQNIISPTDIEFDRKMEDQVQALDTHNSKDFDRILRILESIDHSKYMPQFIEHEIDYQTFLTLEDVDLKELGIKALGSRKKILSVIKELTEQQKSGRSGF